MRGRAIKLDKKVNAPLTLIPKAIEIIGRERWARQTRSEWVDKNIIQVGELDEDFDMEEIEA